MPRALAPSTYALLSSSSTAARTWRKYRDDIAIASVNVGSTALARLVPSAITGKSGMWMENSIISTSATKKFGRLLPTKLAARIIKSVARFCRTAARIPSGIEITSVSSIDIAASSSVAGSFDRNVANTSSPDT